MLNRNLVRIRKTIFEVVGSILLFVLVGISFILLLPLSFIYWLLNTESLLDSLLDFPLIFCNGIIIFIFTPVTDIESV